MTHRTEPYECLLKGKGPELCLLSLKWHNTHTYSLTHSQLRPATESTFFLCCTLKVEAGVVRAVTSPSWRFFTLFYSFFLFLSARLLLPVSAATCTQQWTPIACSSLCLTFSSLSFSFSLCPVTFLFPLPFHSTATFSLSLSRSLQCQTQLCVSVVSLSCQATRMCMDWINLTCATCPV